MASATFEKAQLAKLSCPFTWNLTEIVLNFSYAKNDNTDTDELDDDVPLLRFITSLVSCYEHVISANMPFAKEKLQEAMYTLTDIQKKESALDIQKALEHIYYATQCYLLYETKDNSLKPVLQGIPPVMSFNQKELGALEECKSIAYSMYFEYGVEKAISAATRAVEKDESNALWCYMLAKNLRRKRKYTSPFFPIDLEKKCFEKAYSLSKTPVITISYIRMLHEHLNQQVRASSKERAKFIKANGTSQILNMYKEILNSNPQKYKVLQKAALGLMKYGTEGAHLALDCLDSADKLLPDKSASLHYRALIFQKVGKHKEASKYFERSVEQQNFPAEMSYVSHSWKYFNIDPKKRLFDILTKYQKQRPEQQILLNIGIWYDINDKDVKNAAEYYMKAIKINPNSPLLNNYYEFINFRTGKYGASNFYDYLNKTFLSRLARESRQDTSVIEVYQELKTASNRLKLSEQLNRQMKL